MVRRLGLRWVLYRAGYALRMKSGLLKRRFPRIDAERLPWSDLVLPGKPVEPERYVAFREASPTRFFFKAGHLPDAAVLTGLAAEAGRQRTLEIADNYGRGRFLYYSHHVFDLGWPPNWLLNPFTGGQHESHTHWCDYPTFSPAVAPASSRCGHGMEARATLGDIKDVWEPSRFACAYWLVRAYALTSDEKYPAAFWELFESWRAQNPPNLGPNWKCGQETALRTMAWCFALYGFWGAEATTPSRVVDLVKMIAIQAARIAGNISFAVSQKNNHGLSEATGLLTVGLLLPELKGARRWEALGRRVLEKEVARQIYDDGSYVQHSMNYHRVMLHDLLWAIRLAELNDRPLSAELRGRVAKAGEFLHEMLDDASGRVPNYGANDGALVLPLSSCDYTDYRPAVQAARYQATGCRVLAPGPWDETVLWLFGGVAQPPSAVSFAPVINRCHTGKMPVPQREGEAPAEPAHHSAGPPTSRRFDAGGYYTLRSGDTWCMIRCHTYRDRPAHVDLLHVDLWHKGVNVLGDSGTYKYYVTDNPALERYFKDIPAHNTIELDDASPLNLVSRFLWSPWPKARCIEHHSHRWIGEHYAYRRRPWHIVHRRSIELTDARTWRIVDDLIGTGRRKVTLRWHMGEGACRLADNHHGATLELPGLRMELCVEGPSGLRVELAEGIFEPNRVAGWSSEYYGERRPRPMLEVSGRMALPVRLVTRVGLHEV